MPTKAGEWRIEPGITVSGSFTDNARQEPSSEKEWDLYSTVSPDISVRGEGGRVDVALDYTLDRLDYVRDSSLSEFRHFLRYAGTGELLDDRLFLDTRAAVSQELQDNRRGIPASERSSSDNTTTVATYAVSPSWRNHFGGWADSELRYTFNQVVTGDEDNADLTTHEVTGSLFSGYEFSRLLWGLVGSASESDRTEGPTGDDSLSRRQLELSGEYVVSRQASILASAGYQVIEDPTLDEDVDDAIWSLGGAWRPGPRSSLRLVYGRRDGRNGFAGTASYKVGPQSFISASYSDTIETSQRLAQRDLAFLATDEFGDFIDTRTGDRFALGSSAFGIDDAAFRREIIDVRAHLVGGRNVVDARAFHEIRDTDLTDTTERVTGGTLSWRRALAPATDLSVRLRYSFTDFDTPDGRQDHIGSGGVSLLHRLNETLHGTVSFDSIVRDSDVSGQSFHENLVTVGFRKTF